MSIAAGAKKFGYSLADWDRTKTEMRSALAQCARNEGTISYSELAQQVGPITFQPDARAYHVMLGEISTAEHEEGRGMLTVLVVHKEGDSLPGPGFFELGQRLGYDTTDRLSFWSTECKRVLAAHNSSATNSAT
jgi:hypothetical protein